MSTTTRTAREFLALGDKKDALTAASRLLMKPDAPTYAFSIGVEAMQWDAAHACGLSVNAGQEPRLFAAEVSDVIWG